MPRLNHADPAGSYAGMLRFLDSLERFRGMRLGMGNIRRCLARLGHPEQGYLAVHVAGSKGKGSTAAMLHSLLVAAGHSAGLYTSPHLLDFRERFVIGRCVAGQDDLLEAFREVAAATGGGEDPPLTYFEWATAMALLLFAWRGVGVAVLEVGLGGRLDATRAAGGPLVLMSRIGLEHRIHLGSTVESIAAEKAGVARRGAVVLTAPQVPAAMEVLRSRIKELGGSLLPVAEAADLKIHGTDLSGVSFDFALPGRSFPRLFCRLPGRHQAWNAALAVAGSLWLEKSGFPMPDEAVYAGLAGCRWPGRLDVRGEAPPVILDGAHTTDSIEALVSFLDEVGPGRVWPVVIGILGDKDIEGMMAALARLPVEIYAAPCRTGRTAPPELVARKAAARNLAVAGIFPSVTEALEAAMEKHAAGGPVVVTGSLFAVGEALDLFDGARPRAGAGRYPENDGRRRSAP